MKQIHRVKLTKQNEEFWNNTIAEDPITKEKLTVAWRTFGNREIWYIQNDEGFVSAIVCVAFTRVVPKWYNDLLDRGTILTCYILWSYKKGEGTELIKAIKNEVEQNLKDITQIVTMSPKTEMARNFHLKNGAFTLCENEKTINYCYPITRFAEMV